MVFGGAGGEMEHLLIERLVFRNCRSLNLVTGEADCHAQQEGLNFATLVRWLVTNVTPVQSPARAECDILG